MRANEQQRSERHSGRIMNSAWRCNPCSSARLNAGYHPTCQQSSPAHLCCASVAAPAALCACPAAPIGAPPLGRAPLSPAGTAAGAAADGRGKLGLGITTWLGVRDSRDKLGCKRRAPSCCCCCCCCCCSCCCCWHKKGICSAVPLCLSHLDGCTRAPVPLARLTAKRAACSPRTQPQLTRPRVCRGPGNAQAGEDSGPAPPHTPPCTLLSHQSRGPLDQ
jgi:hypothetical protein